jgi:hypothetical protein
VLCLKKSNRSVRNVTFCFGELKFLLKNLNPPDFSDEPKKGMKQAVAFSVGGI